MVEITEVRAGSPADKAGLQSGDLLDQINDTVIRDVLDYRFVTTESQLHIAFVRNGVRQSVSIHKHEYADLGLEFATPLMDEKKTCGNHCIFCFIDQNPNGMRDTIYVKVTNLTDEDVDRIIRMRLTVNVSVHTTNPELRSKMLGNRKGGEALRHLYRMAEAGLQLNTQIVLCPGWNDGEELHRTLADLFRYVPAVESIAVVPFGMTKHREHLCKIAPFTQETARAAVAQIEAVQAWSLTEHGSRIVYAADELYLLAGLPLPSAETYEEYPQYENGVGMLRSLLDEFYDALADAEYDGGERHLTIATGTAAAPFFRQMMQDLHGKFPAVTCDVIAIENRFYGASVTVAGLLTGQDFLAQLQGQSLGAELLLSETCLRYDDRFLDDMTREELETALGVPVRKNAVDGYALLDAVLGADESM